MPTISRRRFMAGLAAVPLGLGLDPNRVLATDAVTNRRPRPRHGALDVAVVGAGVSGLYAAWRLLTDARSQVETVKVFEAGDYIGGRLLSILPPGIPDMVAELGGMRFLPAVHLRVLKLVNALNRLVGRAGEIRTHSFPLDRVENISYMRGIRLRYADVAANSSRVPYRLERDELGKSPGDILAEAMEQIVPGITAPSLSIDQRRALAGNAKFDSIPLYKQGFWNVLGRVLSWEAFRFCVDTVGYESIFTNWNAADAIPWFLADFGVASNYLGFSGGYQQVPLTLASLLENSGGKIEPNQKLMGFDWAGDSFELDFGDESVKAKALILAMPQRSLELLAPTSPPLRSIPNLINSVTPQPLLKIYLTYDSPWWRSAGSSAGGKFAPLEQGRSITDLPLSQIYYWTRNDGRPVKSGPAMLLASYDDGSDLSYWDGFQPVRDRRRRRLSQTSEADDFQRAAAQRASLPSTHWGKYRPDDRVLSEVQRQLSQVHDTKAAPLVDAAFKDWEDDPFGGGWNNWNIGVRSRDVGRQMIQPQEKRNLPLYVCGEAYSDFQGWVEGALQTADMVLRKFGLNPL